MAEDLGEKTEPATDRRRRQMREEGQIPRSTDLSGALALTGALAGLIALGPYMLNNWRLTMYEFLSGGLTTSLDGSNSAMHYMSVALWTAVRISGPFLIVTAVVGLLTTGWQVGPMLTAKPLQPRLSRLNPLAGLKKFASIRTLARAGSNMAKVLIVIIVAVSVIGRHVQDILTLSQLEAPQAVIKAAELVLELAFWLLVALLILGFIDYVYQRWQWERDNRMSKQAIKEEMRNMIGDPTARKRQRDFALSILRQRMGQAVPSADVIVTNPEHLAIALKWDPETMNAPKVVAKGADYLAIRIRQLAMANGVPIVERKPLARAMYPLVRVGDEIPPRFYQAIAELLAYVYRLNGKMAG
ncbi:MAG: flagellar biosynthesis protein FlhB [Planctomycetes bacterium]|nr:flagellar biosynthesis protein FlhB [Planctomycetota bacterium]